MTLSFFPSMYLGILDSDNLFDLVQATRGDQEQAAIVLLNFISDHYASSEEVAKKIFIDKDPEYLIMINFHLSVNSHMSLQSYPLPEGYLYGPFYLDWDHDLRSAFMHNRQNDISDFDFVDNPLAIIAGTINQRPLNETKAVCESSLTLDKQSALLTQALATANILEGASSTIELHRGYQSAPTLISAPLKNNC